MKTQRSKALKGFIIGAGAGGMICLICNLLCENDKVLSKAYLILSFLMLSVAIGVLIGAVKRKSAAIRKSAAFNFIIPASVSMIIFMTISILELTNGFFAGKGILGILCIGLMAAALTVFCVIYRKTFKHNSYTPGIVSKESDD